jgi:hypothetical protein
MRSGTLADCDAVACRLDGATIPRQDIVWIGLEDPSLPPPEVQRPLEDELHLRDGGVRPGPVLAIDARQVVTPERAYGRGEVRWIYLAPAEVAGRGAGAPRGPQTAPQTAACGFWLGWLRQRREWRNQQGDYLNVEQRDTSYAVRLREGPPSMPGLLSVGRRRLRAREVALHVDEAFVRERAQGYLAGDGGNRSAGTGAGSTGPQRQPGRLVLAEPSGRVYYRFAVVPGALRYRSTVHWVRGATTHAELRPARIDVGMAPDPEAWRILGRLDDVMRGEYTTSEGAEGRDQSTYVVAWELTRRTAPCAAPPPLPPGAPEGDPVGARP